MTIAANQPYFLPYIGYFQLIKAVDMFVICDDFQYIKQGWINRNFFLSNGEPLRFNLILIGASIHKQINEIEIAPDQSHLIRSFQQHYAKAPYYNAVAPLIENIFNYENRNLARFIGNSLKLIADYLHFNTEFAYSSELAMDHSLRSQARVINICETVNAKCYINAIGGTELYDKETFSAHGIDLKFIKSSPIEYKQYKPPFVPELSMLDVMMFNSVEAIGNLLTQYTLI